MTNPTESAFPTWSRLYGEKPELDGDGLTKREHFAAMAMQGQLSNPAILERHGLEAKDVAKTAVDFADALIAALNKQP
jgi:hypothetical protein